jgi:uncharacterized protein
MRQLIVALIVVFSATALHAQDDGSYISPFPQGENYRVDVIGDTLAEGLLYGLREDMARDSQVSITSSTTYLSRITFNTFSGKLAELKENLSGSHTQIAVIILGTQDERALRDDSGGRHWIDAPQWRTEYANRVDSMMKTLKSVGIAIYWVGLPIMRSGSDNRAAQIINDIIRERAYLNSVKFIDIYSSFADEQGEYSAYGPDLAGNVKRLRWRDGIHFTGTGYSKVAHYVAREMRRDLAVAKSERTIPLAGSEPEQALIRSAQTPETKSGDKVPSDWEATTERTRQSVVARPSPGPYFFGGAGGEQPEQNARLNLKAIGPNGREQIVSLEILRPAIPASIVALVTRKQSRARNAQIGDTLVDETVNGYNIMSTITPATDALDIGGRRKLSLAQSPFFRVLVKGERLEPKNGRADDFSWPRPELPAPPPVEPAELGHDEEGGGIPLPPSSPFRPRA